MMQADFIHAPIGKTQRGNVRVDVGPQLGDRRVFAGRVIDVDITVEPPWSATEVEAKGLARRPQARPMDPRRHIAVGRCGGFRWSCRYGPDRTATIDPFANPRMIAPGGYGPCQAIAGGGELPVLKLRQPLPQMLDGGVDGLRRPGK